MLLNWTFSKNWLEMPPCSKTVSIKTQLLYRMVIQQDILELNWGEKIKNMLTPPNYPNAEPDGPPLGEYKQPIAMH